MSRTVATRDPFVGLRPFGPDDTEIFFGRERDVAILKNRVLALPIVVVYAVSGTGKSSLLTAGLVPSLEEEDDVSTVYINDPAEDIAAATARGLGVAGVRPALAEILKVHRQTSGRRAVVILDQLEERFAKASDELWDELAEAAASGAGTLVLCLREDYIGSLEGLIKRVPGLMDASFRIPSLSDDTLADAVRRPIEAVGSGVSVSAELIAEVLRDLRSQADGSLQGARIEPGYFQVVWDHLWKRSETQARGRITQSSYVSAGRAEGILASFVAVALDTLTPFEAEFLYAAIRYMILPTGAKAPMTVEDLVELTQPSDLTELGQTLLGSLLPARWIVTSVLEKLSRSTAPLFRRVVRGTRAEYELQHDILGPILLRWRRDFATSAPARREQLLGAGSLDLWSIRHPLGRFRGIEDVYERRLSDLVHDLDRRMSAISFESLFTDEFETSLEALREIVHLANEPAARLVPEFHDLIARADTYAESVTTIVTRALIDGTEGARSPESQRQAALLLVLAWAISAFAAEPHALSYASDRLHGMRLVFRAAEAGIAVVAAVASGLYLSNWVMARFLDRPIDYFGLSVTVLGAWFVLLYVTMPGGQWTRASGSLREALRDNLFPRPEYRHGELGIALLRVVNWWPLPLLYSLGLAYLGALVFDSLGWAPTAGFNFVGLFAGVGCGITWIIAAD